MKEDRLRERAVCTWSSRKPNSSGCSPWACGWGRPRKMPGALHSMAVSLIDLAWWSSQLRHNSPDIALPTALPVVLAVAKKPWA